MDWSTILSMDLSTILNYVFGTGLVATLISLLSIRSELRKVRAEAKKAEAGAQALFGGVTLQNADVPELVLTDADFEEDGTIGVRNICVKAGFEKSLGQAGKTIDGGGLTVDDEKVADKFAKYTKEDLKDGKLFRKGKKNFKKVLYRA